MSRILVLFASHFGQTHAIATRIGQRLRGLGHEVDVVDLGSGPHGLPPPEDYDAIVLGSRVELGHHASSVASYVRVHREMLDEMPTAFFSVSMAASRPSAGPDPGGYLGTLFAELGWKPTCSVAFAGGLPYRRYGWIRRFVMTRISRKAGYTTDTSRNHELTDWKRVSGFASEVAAMVPEEQLVHQL